VIRFVLNGVALVGTVMLLGVAVIYFLSFFVHPYDKKFDQFDPSSPGYVPYVPMGQMEPFELDLNGPPAPLPAADLFGNSLGLRAPGRISCINELSDE